MPTLRRPVLVQLLLSAITATVLLTGCRSAPEAPLEDAASGDVVVISPEEQRLALLEADLARTQEELAGERERANELQAQVDELLNTKADLEATIAETETRARDASTAYDQELDELRAERESLLADLERLATAAQTPPPTSVASGTAASGGSGNQEALAEALSGRSGFRRVESFARENDRRLAARLAVDGSGLAVDASGSTPVLFDPTLSFETSLIYLTIVDPGGRDPQLILTVQYVSDVRPLYAQTAFITIDGADPIDPVDPIIFSGNPVRETDGVRVRELFSREVNRTMLTRISSMLSASGFRSTFVGTIGRASHTPTAVERQAMSRVLFAFIDLGGYR